MDPWKIKKNISNIFGWSTKRKIIVIQIDDFGAIRLRSKEARDSLIAKGHTLKNNRFDHFDSLESKEDLESLFEVLHGVKDCNGNPCIVTAVSVVANPDFSKIKDAGFNKYYHKSLIETYKEYYVSDDITGLWKEGIEAMLIRPEFHGREHLNPNLWIRALKSGENIILDAFNEESMVGQSKLLSQYKGGHYFAYDFEDEIDLKQQKESLKQGLALFENIFGFKAKQFTSSGLIHPTEIELYLKNEGITIVDVAKKKFEPKGAGVYKKKYYAIGKRNKYGQVYITRNARFEPNDKSRNDWVGSTLNDIRVAFRWNKPAIISSHRVNFAGTIDPTNRTQGLIMLEDLLKKITRMWPDVEFMSVSELADTINETKKHPNV